ncbi:MAG: MCE family protein [candidate division WOR-3 bacterium]|nr:MAG: MCE family protein [candidate division WOR-3 bacterium]
MTKGVRQSLVGVFVILGVVIFIMLYTWLSGKIFFSNTYDIRVYFDDVEGLRIGDPVLVFGIEKGKVKSLRIEGDHVDVILAMDRDVILPDDSEITIRAVSYIGADKYVKVTPGSGNKIPDVYYGTGGSLELESLAAQVDSLMQRFGALKMPDLDGAVRKLSADLSRSIDRLLEMFEGPVDKLDALVVRIDSLSSLLKGDGTVGQLLTSDELYQELRETNLALKALIQDINENPKKYINIKVF